MTIGIHAPMPPARTGVADYAATLAAALAESGSVLVNPTQPAGVELYHMGNNQLHQPIYRRALAHPGATVFHDAALNHFYLGSLDRQSYVEEFVYNYGEWTRDLAQQLWSDRARSAQDGRYFENPMLRRLAEASRLAIVHNPAAAGRVRRHAPATPVVEIPHLFAPPVLPPPDRVEDLRSRLGLIPGATLFGVFGHLRESKRLAPVLRAFTAVRRQHSGAQLLVAGSFASPNLEQSLGPLLAPDGIHRAGYLAEEDFWLHAAAIDVCVNLRHPSAGETSGIAVRLMGIGKAVLVTSGEETARYPEHACLRVDPGAAEQAMLEAYMSWLAATPGAIRQIGSAAAAHIAAHHSPAHCAALYRQAISGLDPSP